MEWSRGSKGGPRIKGKGGKVDGAITEFIG